MKASVDGNGIARIGPGLAVQLTSQQREKIASHKDVTLGLRAHSLRMSPASDKDFAVEADVDLSEISGSETYVHVHHGQTSLVAQLPGVHNIDLGGHCRMYFRPDEMFVYSSKGDLMFAPHHSGGSRGSH
jgi:glycerol transport system ATP-binding protein